MNFGLNLSLNNRVESVFSLNTRIWNEQSAIFCTDRCFIAVYVILAHRQLLALEALKLPFPEIVIVFIHIWGLLIIAQYPRH